MNRRNLIKVICGMIVLYITVWIGFVWWLTNRYTEKHWLVDIDADPAAAPLPNVTKEDWVAKLADPNFASLSQAERIIIADERFAKTKALAEGAGYDLKELQRWYRQTAVDFARYPVRKFVFAQGMETDYRDLRESGFPKFSRFQVFWELFFSKYSILIALVALPFAAILLLLDRKSTRLNSSHMSISYAVFCLKK